MIGPLKRAAITSDYRRGELLKEIAARHGVSISSVSAIAREEGAKRRFGRAKRRKGPLLLAGPTVSQQGALNRLRRIKLMRIAMLRTGRVADRSLVEEIRL